MSSVRYWSRPGIDISGLIPPDAELLSKEQYDEHISQIIMAGMRRSPGYIVSCLEETRRPTGEITWAGETCYKFDTLKAMRKFLVKRLVALGERDERFQLQDENGMPSDECLVTMAITGIEKVEVRAEART